MIKCTINRLNKKKKKLIKILNEQLVNSLDIDNRSFDVLASRNKTESLILQLGGEYSPEVRELFPPVIFIHQLSSYQDLILLTNNVEALTQSGVLLQVNVPSLNPSKAVLHFQELKKWLIEHRKPNQRILFFINNVLAHLSLVEINSTTLKDHFKLTDRDIKDIINFGLLVLLGNKKYALTFPGAGYFAKLFQKGRSAILSALKKSSEKELLLSDMQRRSSVESSVKLGLKLQINDIIGLKIAECVETSEGVFIRYLGD